MWRARVTHHCTWDTVAPTHPSCSADKLCGLERVTLPLWAGENEDHVLWLLYLWLKLNTNLDVARWWPSLCIFHWVSAFKKMEERNPQKSLLKSKWFNKHVAFKRARILPSSPLHSLLRTVPSIQWVLNKYLLNWWICSLSYLLIHSLSKESSALVLWQPLPVPTKE